jgi:hypothetical protein
VRFEGLIQECVGGVENKLYNLIHVNIHLQPPRTQGLRLLPASSIAGCLEISTLLIGVGQVGGRWIAPAARVACHLERPGPRGYYGWVLGLCSLEVLCTTFFLSGLGLGLVLSHPSCIYIGVYSNTINCFVRESIPFPEEGTSRQCPS